MEFKSLSGSTDFAIERDFRNTWIAKKGLWIYLASKVLDGKGNPITSRTVRNAFKVESYNKLTPTLMAVWLESEPIVERVMQESEVYENKE